MEGHENPLLGDDAPQHRNPLLGETPTDPLVDLEKIKSPAELARARRGAKRLLRDHRRAPNAEAAIAEFSKDVYVYGFTKGQFSLIQLITAALARTGPAELVLSTWTAANQDVTEVLAFCSSGLVTRARWLVDLTFSRRSPQLAQRIRDVFGDDAIRVGKNHAKFALLGNAEWQVVIHTSMNLNHNPRFENFEIANDPELYAFHQAIIDEIWRKQAREVEGMRPGEIGRHFDQDL
jgi:hypothetical protein